MISKAVPTGIAIDSTRGASETSWCGQPGSEPVGVFSRMPSCRSYGALNSFAAVKHMGHGWCSRMGGALSKCERQCWPAWMSFSVMQGSTLAFVDINPASHCSPTQQHGNRQKTASPFKTSACPFEWDSARLPSEFTVFCGPHAGASHVDSTHASETAWCG